ncbi:MAG: dephospho-CoA kinase [Balneolaceae bacterium]
MIRTGITGGIGSGKSTICKCWRDLGAYVVNSDQLAKELMVQDSRLREEIRFHFGTKAYKQDGSLNRHYLARAAFREGRVEELNRLVHPVLKREIQSLIEVAESEGHPMFVQEAAILLNNGRPGYLDYVVLVRAEKSRRMMWVAERDSMSEADVEARMGAQSSDEDLQPLCDYIIENNSTKNELIRKAEELYRTIIHHREPSRKA